MGRTVDFSLYLITDRRVNPSRGLLEGVEAALQGGVRAVQLREKDLPTRDLLDLARQARALTARYGARLFVNDRVDIALAVEADGAHLPQAGLPVQAVRRLVPEGFLLGVSTHHLAEVREAAEGGADFATFGPVYHTPSKAAYGAPVGVDTLRDACASVDLPLFALGGVTAERLPEILEAGARGIACIGAILGAPDPKGAAMELVEGLKIRDSLQLP
ncbi:MAG: thiamine phosphate synthase [Nitrospirae bacterium]|nr:thiamine phosphate synthase [Nitrospirota bacterium]